MGGGGEGEAEEGEGDEEAEMGDGGVSGGGSRGVVVRERRHC